MKFTHWSMNLLYGAVLTLISAASLPAIAEDELPTATQDFQNYCAQCHGAEGRGDGPMAAELQTAPSDLTRIAARNDGVFSSEDVYYTIEGLDMSVSHVAGDMPVWGFWFMGQAVGEGILLEDAEPAEDRVRDRIEALVDYLETLQE